MGTLMEKDDSLQKPEHTNATLHVVWRLFIASSYEEKQHKYALGTVLLHRNEGTDVDSAYKLTRYRPETNIYIQFNMITNQIIKIIYSFVLL